MSDENVEDDENNEEMDDISKIKNIVNIASNQKNPFEEYKHFSETIKSFSPLERKEGSELLIFEKESIFQSYFKQMKESNQLRSKYTMLNSNNDIMYELNQDIILHLDVNIPFILGSLFLPLSIQILEDGSWIIENKMMNFNSVLFELLKTKNRKFKWAGLIPYQPNNNFTIEKEKELLSFLENKYNCYGILVDEDKIVDFVQKFYLNYFDNIISNLIEEDYNQVFNFSEEAWSYFKEMNKLIAGRIVEQLEDNTLVYIVDYRIFLTTGMISYTSSKTSIGLFWNHSFPTLDNFKYFPFKHELLLSILCSNVICFIDFRYARSFFSIAKSIIGLDYQSLRGVLFLLYLGRKILIKISNMVPDYSTIKNLQNSKKYEDCLAKWKKKLGSYDLILSINTLDIFNLSLIKFDLLKEFYKNSNNKGKVKFVQVIQNDSYDDNIEYKNSKQSLLDIINRKDELNSYFDSDLFIIINEKLTILDLLAIMSISQVFLRAQIKPKNLFMCLAYLISNEEQNVVFISEFACYSKISKSFETFNLFKKDEFVLKLEKLLFQRDKDLQKYNVLQDKEYFKENSSLTWLNNSLLDIQQTGSMIKYAQISSISMGSQYLKVLTNKRFKHLDTRLTVNNYHKKNSNRLIILDIDGTLLPQEKYTHFESKKNKITARFFQTPDEKVIQDLKSLTNDPANTVFLITGKSYDILSPVFKNINNLGIACEYGYILKDCSKCNEKSFWAKISNFNLDFKEKAKEIILKYVESTELSIIEEKESGIVWKYGDVDKELGAKKCEQLYIELKQKLEGEIDIVFSKDYLEVRPFGMNKVNKKEIIRVFFAILSF